jgi:hypothetical protein
MTISSRGEIERLPHFANPPRSRQLGRSSWHLFHEIFTVHGGFVTKFFLFFEREVYGDLAVSLCSFMLFRPEEKHAEVKNMGS